MASFMDVFFEEKNVECKTWEIVDNSGMTHIISSDVVIEAIKCTSGTERKEIEIILRKIDFNNGDVNHFLHHLAIALVNQ